MSLRCLIFAIAAAAAALLASCAPGIAPDMLDAMRTIKFQPVGKGDDAVKLAVHEQGKGKPIVLLHGLGASSYTWHKIMPALAKTNRVIAIDLKGFGQSDKPLDNHYSIFDQARLVEDYIDRLNLHNVTLIGHSFGGGVALAVALNQIETGRKDIERLVLIDSVAYAQPLPFFFRVLRTPVLGEIGMSLIPPEVQMERALAMAYHEDGKVTPETVANYASALHSEGGRHALLNTINSLDPDQAEAFSKRYPTLKLPALLLWCEHDKIVPLRFGKRLAGDLPDSRIEVIEECGHIPHEEQPEQTLRAIRQFIAAGANGHGS
ncbi:MULTISPECIES: alpha/beta hydrolase [Rhodomicrobium]|uniref:alpha/beta fold hydrolase n=1 Tax=Rhodomicrobium TaxID=1068 RepID=UPI000B4B8D70|nr:MULTISPECIES: alpha/beta hydrolase [Rhodomicrobium]